MIRLMTRTAAVQRIWRATSSSSLAKPCVRTAGVLRAYSTADDGRKRKTQVKLVDLPSAALGPNGEPRAPLPPLRRRRSKPLVLSVLSNFDVELVSIAN